MRFAKKLDSNSKWKKFGAYVPFLLVIRKKLKFNSSMMHRARLPFQQLLQPHQDAPLTGQNHRLVGCLVSAAPHSWGLLQVGLRDQHKVLRRPSGQRELKN